MEIIVMELSAALLLAVIVLLFRRQRSATQNRDGAEHQVGEPPARIAAAAQQNYLNRLANLHENLALLDERTTAMERKIESVLKAPLQERRQHFEAAALLFAAGHDGSRIAAMLDLPLAQVEMISAVKNVFDSGGKTNPEIAPPPARTAKRKALTRSPKAKSRAILLTDIVESGHAANGAMA
jgi:hypothetical protein